MVERILTTVIFDDRDAELCLECDREANVITVYLDGDEVFAGDYVGNLQKVFFRAVQLWTDVEDFKSEV